MNTNIANKIFLSKPGEGETLVSSGMQLRVGTNQNGGAFELFEISGSGNPPPHVHREHDECFYILEGVFTFTIGTEEVEVAAGSVVFVPRGVRHAFRHTSGARALFFVAPANLEGFFRELGQGLATGVPEAELRAVLAGKYDSWPAK